MGFSSPAAASGGSGALPTVPVALIGSGDRGTFIPVYEDGLGTPTKVLTGSIESTSSASVRVNERVGCSYVHTSKMGGPGGYGMGFTSAAQCDSYQFAICCPACSGDGLVIFSEGNNGACDVFAISSGVIAACEAAITAALATIAGCNAPADGPNLHISVPVTKSRIMTFKAGAVFFGDITHNACTGVYTFTYTDASVACLGGDVVPAADPGWQWSGQTIGCQVFLLHGGEIVGQNEAWEFTPAGAVVTEWQNFRQGGIGMSNSSAGLHMVGVGAECGNFTIAYPIGGEGSGAEAFYIQERLYLDCLCNCG